VSLLRDALVALTYPLALTLAVLLLALLLQRLRWTRTAGVLALAAFAWSAFWSIPHNAEWLRSSLEQVLRSSWLPPMPGGARCTGLAIARTAYDSETREYRGPARCRGCQPSDPQLIFTQINWRRCRVHDR